MATKPLPADYFSGGVFAAAGPELLRAYTCVGCGLRSVTWAAFRRHRAGCSERVHPRAAGLGPPAALQALAAFVRAEAAEPEEVSRRAGNAP